MLQNPETNSVKYIILAIQKIEEIWLIKNYNDKKNHSVETDPEIKDNVTTKGIKIVNINMLCMFKKIWGIMTMIRRDMKDIMKI